MQERRAFLAAAIAEDDERLEAAEAEDDDDAETDLAILEADVSNAVSDLDHWIKTARKAKAKDLQTEGLEALAEIASALREAVGE